MSNSQKQWENIFADDSLWVTQRCSSTQLDKRLGVSKKPKGFSHNPTRLDTVTISQKTPTNIDKTHHQQIAQMRKSKIEGIKEKTVSRPLRQLYMEILDTANHRRHHLPTYCSKQKRSIQTVSTTTFMTNKHNQSIESRFCWFTNSFKHWRYHTTQQSADDKNMLQ